MVLGFRSLFAVIALSVCAAVAWAITPIAQAISYGLSVAFPATASTETPRLAFASERAYRAPLLARSSAFVARKLQRFSLRRGLMADNPSGGLCFAC